MVIRGRGRGEEGREGGGEIVREQERDISDDDVAMIFLHSSLSVAVLRSSGMERAVYSKILFIQFSL